MMDVLLHRAYLCGYAGYALPRWARRALARTGLHRAWLLGSHGCFEEAGARYGPTNPYGIRNQRAL